MSYWIEEDEWDRETMERSVCSQNGSSAYGADSLSIEERFDCCICGMDISLLLHNPPFLYSELTPQSEQQRNDHISLCLSRSEHGKSTKRNIKDFFSNKVSSPPMSSTPSLVVPPKNVPSSFIGKANPSAKRGVRRLAKPQRSTRQPAAAMKKSEPIDVPNSIMHTRFARDWFKGNWTSTYFLSHMHSDHTTGLGRSFRKGVIIATPTTCRLVMNKFGLPESTFVPVAIGTRIYLTNASGAEFEAVERWVHNETSESPTVRFNSDVSDTGDVSVVAVDVIEANHCPGACMFLFSLYHWTASSANLFFTTLYTGDFRNTEELIQSTVLKEYTLSQNRCIDHIYLDNTYCDKRYAFPPQSTIIRTVIHILKKYYLTAIQKKQTLVLFSTYTIGKENVWLAAAKELGMRIYVDAAKEKILECYADYDSEYKAWITTDPLSTSLHVGGFSSIGQVKKDGLDKQYDRVVLISATGWEYDSISKKPPEDPQLCNYSFRRSGNIIKYGFPYSEHSSYTELCDFVEQLRHRSISFIVDGQGSVDLLEQTHSSTQTSISTLFSSPLSS